jgi:hypothetical protein
VVHFVDEIGQQVSVPAWVTDLASFRRWSDSDDFPESGRIWYLKGEVWVDLSRQELFTHVAVKGECSMVVAGLVRAGRLGLYFPDGAYLSNVDADFDCKPDATFVSNAGLRDRVRLIEGKDGGYVELEGSPDMVLEVVSTSSVRKDTVVLRRAYWEAGIREYWLVDARREPLTFDILRHTARGYAATRKADSWVRSAVFGKSFRLTRQTNALGHPEYSLEVR